MRDLNITLEGSWWDTLLYKGKLHAITPEGDWEIFDWDALISNLEVAIEAAERPAFRFSFRASNAIKNGLFSSQAVAESFRALTKKEFFVSSRKMAEYSLSKSDVSVAFPSTSMSMHYDRMIMSSPNGVHVEYVNPEGIDVHSLKKISSIATRQVATAYGKIACASGDAGLRQLDLHLDQGFRPTESEGQELNTASCDACDWMYQNISATSYGGESYIAKFNRTRRFFAAERGGDLDNQGEDARIEEIAFAGNEKLDEGIEESNSEPHSTLSWGSHDKIYKVVGKSLKAFRFAASGDRPHLGDIELPGAADEIVSVRSALFGVVIEFDDSVVVVKGDGTSVVFAGEPVNISSFSRSRSYENQLHLILDDEVQVKSLNLGFEAEGFYEKKFGSRAPDGWFD